MRYKLEISYDGSNYYGFQIQKGVDTIQERLEHAVSIVLNKNIDIIASGRTDAGVSAIKQVCHFDYDGDINLNRLKGYANNLLPRDIRIISISSISSDFNARFSAKQKTYEYFFYVGEEIPVYERFATRLGCFLDIDKMREGCKYINGIHDFSCFCASNTNVIDKVREIKDIDIKVLDDNLYKLIITGNGFLYNMVRIIMGTLVSVGMGKIRPNQISDIIESKDRSNSGKTMPSKGLYLKNVKY